ncbi:SMI1/KNR4 family protein [Paenibacillus puerhi]|uniref:SMI1/KNR4 family protein n=1 Tax=Paenibacillus puerhi TaxID=2692622 RepID=UPI001F3A0971|nr:SMI1/KNR4 family protein [Paenibacillus puerhi]
MNIKQLLIKIKTLPDCIVYPPTVSPIVEREHVVPLDVHEFYKICGGIELFTSSDYSISIVSPKKFVLANPVIVGERCEGDISSNWYIVADDGNGDYLTIDLAKERLGKCYDSFWDKHGVAGDCPIIATSFTDLLLRFMETKGKRWYWLQDDFVSMGDAYDNV